MQTEDLQDSPAARIALYDFAFEHAPIGLATVDTKGRIIRGNQTFSRLVGIEQEKLSGTPFADFTHPDDLHADITLFNEVLSGLRDGYTIGKRYVRPEGSIVHVVIHVAAMRDASGKVVRFLSQIEDVTLQKQQERDLAEKAAQLELAMEAVQGGFWHMDVATDRFETSDRLAQFIDGPAAAKLDLQHYLDKVNPKDVGAADLSLLLSGQVDQSVAEYRLQTVDGEKWIRCDRRLLRDVDGRPRRIVGVAIDFTTERRRIEASERNSETDALTGLLNRRGLYNRYGLMTSTGGWSVLAIDLDGFKEINDTTGHAGGDRVLVEAAKRLTETVGQTDLVCRAGGDEFVLVVSGTKQHGEEVAERLVQILRKPLDVGLGPTRLSASVGVVWSPGKSDIQELNVLADALLYQAKAAGKNQWKSCNSQ
ncbi:diguanylate cyclase domain-containing protein [Oryzifoliimicrobium ureilyticus]|uniref:diguanylate cyclase domain-containing protein n=1 Tax=Oryzifoliimicrobium ureilyticus TaxID=3113724 RepID=UPI0030765B82